VKAQVVPDRAAADTKQLKYKDFDEYKAEVSIEKITLAVDPLPEYAAVTPEKIVPYEVLVPTAETNAQESRLQGPGKLKY
jgi:hypothetical protein